MIGMTLGQRYQLVSQIGEGGMAIVYLARDLKLERQVAIKVLHPHMTKNVEIRKRFVREAKAISSLDHPNVVRVYDYSESDAGQNWIVSEYIDGLNLADWAHQRTKNGKIPVALSTMIVREICKALGAAHNRGIIHRDIKPENVMLTRRGQVKLMDFGIAKDMAHSSMTQTGTFMGSPSYMSCEQIKGRDVDYRSDIYSLSVLFYEIISGSLPFKGNSQHDVIMKIMEGNAQNILSLETNLDPNLAELIHKGIQRDPTYRFQTVEELGYALDLWLQKQGYAESHIELERYFSQTPKVQISHQTPIIAESMPQAAAIASRESTRTSLRQAASGELASDSDSLPTQEILTVLTHQGEPDLPKTVLAQDSSTRLLPPEPRVPPIHGRSAANKGKVANTQGPEMRSRRGHQTKMTSSRKKQRKASGRSDGHKSAPTARPFIRTAENLESYFVKGKRRIQLPIAAIIVAFCVVTVLIIFKQAPRESMETLTQIADIFQIEPDSSDQVERDPLQVKPAPVKNSQAILPKNTGKLPAPKTPAQKPVASRPSPNPDSVAPSISVKQASKPVEPISDQWQFSSTPAADVYINGVKVGTTNAEGSSSGWIAVPAAQSTISLRRDGYRPFEKTVQNLGGKKSIHPHITLIRAAQANLTFTVQPQFVGTKIQLRQIDAKKDMPRVFAVTLHSQRLIVQVPFGSYELTQSLGQRKRVRVITLSDTYRDMTYIVEYD